MQKAQAAVEFLMTYGWAILVVLIVTGALAYFGVLNPSNLVPEKCVLGGGLKCTDFQLQFQRVTIRVENTLARDMQITRVELFSKDLDGENCSTTTNIVLKPLTSADVEINDCAFISAGKKKAKVNVVYKYGSDIDHTQGGDLVLQVDNPYTLSGPHNDSCSDNDGGVIYYTEGIVSGWYNNNYYNMVDLCNATDMIHINEYYCNGNYANSTSYSCPNGCKIGFGKCKDPDSCDDSDGGVTYGTFGTVSGNLSGYPYSYPDTCLNTTLLTEFYCSGTSSLSINYTCPYGCSGQICNAAPGDSCEDTDGGQIYNISGTVSGNAGGSPYSFADSCLNATTLTEFFCSEASSQSINYTCPFGCFNKKCNPAPADSCTDSDGGNNYNVLGNVSGNASGSPYLYTDECTDGTHLREYNCTGNSQTSTIYTCPDICQGGICTTSAVPDSCDDSDGGKVYTIKGNVTGNASGTPYTYYDTCTDATNLKEYNCSGVAPTFVTNACTYGCSSGQCNAAPSCTGTLTCSGLSQANCQSCPVCSYTAESCSGTASLCNTYGSQSNCELCGCSWGVSTIQKVGSDVTGYVASGTGSQAISLPAGLQAGDIVIVAVASDLNLSIDGVIGQGYTDIVRSSVSDELPGRNIAYKVMGSTPDSTVSIELRGTVRSAYVIQAWRGVHANVFDVSTPAEATGGSGDPNAPAITPAIAGALVIAIGMQDDDDSTVTSHPTGYTNGVSANTGQASTTVGATVAMASKTWSSGIEDPSIWVMSGSDAWKAITIALRPAGGCSGTPNSCAIGTCEATCGCSYTAGSCSNSGSCATCPVGDCNNCLAAGCSLS